MRAVHDFINFRQFIVAKKSNIGEFGVFYKYSFLGCF